jgi:hypothetical protein
MPRASRQCIVFAPAFYVAHSDGDVRNAYISICDKRFVNDDCHEKSPKTIEDNKESKIFAAALPRDVVNTVDEVCVNALSLAADEHFDI